MPIATPKQNEPEIFTTVDDEQYDELCELAGQTIVYNAVWEDSLTEALDDDLNRELHEDGILADIDLYLRDGVYFELYGSLCYPDLTSDPYSDLISIERALQDARSRQATLHEVAVDDEDGLVLVLGVGDKPILYILVGAWILDEWDELPESASP